MLISSKAVVMLVTRFCFAFLIERHKAFLLIERHNHFSFVNCSKRCESCKLLWPLLCFQVSVANACFWRSKKDYIEKELLELDPREFFIAFGFKTRKYGEEEFIKAVKDVYASTENTAFKDFLYDEFIRCDFQVECFNYISDILYRSWHFISVYTKASIWTCIGWRTKRKFAQPTTSNENLIM